MDLLYAIFISPIETVLHVVLSLSYLATGHYGASLFILSLCVNLALLPIYHMADAWQQVERDMQRRLQPKLQELREAFSGEERFMMVRTLYRQAGYHPIYAVRGSLGVLIQVPFFIAAYHLLSHYPPLAGVPAFIFEDLSKPDALLAGINVMPFVMTGMNLLSAYVYAQKLRNADILQLWMISLVFLVVLYGSAVALLLYWTFNNVFSLLKNMAYAQLTVNSASGVGLADTFRGKLAQLHELPVGFNLALFLMVVAVQAIGPMNMFSSLGVAPANNRVVIASAIVVSIVMLAYLCMVSSWKASLGARAVDPRARFRAEANIVVVWMLFAVLVVTNGAWLSDLYPDTHYSKILAGIVLMLSFLLFASPLCGHIRILSAMPDDHSLYIISTSLLACAVFVANPISFYVHSGDFSGGINGVVSALLIYSLIAVLASTSLYLLADNPVRKCLTVLSVFFACSAIAYAAIGVKNVGIMVHFALWHPELLLRTNAEIVAEVAILLALFAATTKLALSYRRRVTQVAGAMLCVSLCVAVLDVYTYEENGDAVRVPHELPVNKQDVLGFSREQNVLVILLDGFPGGYIQKIMNEVPNTLSEYQGFVWYPNTLTTSAATMSSLPSLMGGQKYTVLQINNGGHGTIGSAMKEAYRVYPDTFIPQEYQVTYLVDPAFNNGCEGIDQRVQCVRPVPYGIYYHDKEEPDAPLWDDDDTHVHSPPILAMLSVFKVSPFFLKYWIYQGGTYHGALSETIRTRRANTFKINDWGFLHVLARESNADSTSKTFKFIHLQIPHGPYAFSDDCRLLPTRATVFSETVCALKEIGLLLSWMKNNGVYDATKIVVVSDHGWWVENPMFPADFSQVVPKGDRGLAGPGTVQPLLLVKDFGAKGTLRRSEMFLSNSDVPSIVCATVGGCRDVAPDPTITDPRDRILTFTIVGENNPEEERASKFSVLDVYEVRDNIFNPHNWIKVQ